MTDTLRLAQIATALETLAGASTPGNASAAGYWSRIAAALETETSFTSSANATQFGSMKRAALALEDYAGTSGAEENATEAGYLKRMVDALETDTGVTAGSWIKRLHAAATIWTGAAPPVTPSTWNPADKSAGLTLSGGNLTWLADKSGNARGVRGTQSKTDGKRYYEATCILNSLGCFGFADATEVLNAGPGGTVHAIGYYDSGSVNYAGGSTAVASYTTADILAAAIDIPNRLVWFRKNGTWLNGGDPAAGTGGFSIAGMASPVFPFAGTWFTNDAEQTANFGATAFAYAPPTGFTAWDS